MGAWTCWLLHFPKGKDTQLNTDTRRKSWANEPWGQRSGGPLRQRWFQSPQGHPLSCRLLLAASSAFGPQMLCWQAKTLASGFHWLLVFSSQALKKKERKKERKKRSSVLVRVRSTNLRSSYDLTTSQLSAAMRKWVSLTASVSSLVNRNKNTLSSKGQMPTL